MSKYVLVKSINRELSCDFFPTYESAYKEMEKTYMEFLEEDTNDIYESGESYIYEDNAYITTCYDNVDMIIREVK